MVMLYLPDTNAFSRYLRRSDSRLVEMMNLHLPDLRLSVIVLAELEYGAAKRRDVPTFARRVESLRSLVDGAPFLEEDAIEFGKIRAHLETLKPNAQLIGGFDMLIAAQAVRMGATLVTGNTREFARVPGLLLENWQDV